MSKSTNRNSLLLVITCLLISSSTKIITYQEEEEEFLFLPLDLISSVTFFCTSFDPHTNRWRSSSLALPSCFWICGFEKRQPNRILNSHACFLRKNVITFTYLLCKLVKCAYFWIQIGTFWMELVGPDHLL